MCQYPLSKTHAHALLSNALSASLQCRCQIYWFDSVLESYYSPPGGLWSLRPTRILDSLHSRIPQSRPRDFLRKLVMVLWIQKAPIGECRHIRPMSMARISLIGSGSSWFGMTFTAKRKIKNWSRIFGVDSRAWRPSALINLHNATKHVCHKHDARMGSRIRMHHQWPIYEG